MGDGVDLMGPQGDLRVHTHKIQVAPVVLAGPGAVELVVIEPRQAFSPGRVFPNPILERLLDKLLLALGDGGFFLVQDGGFLPISIFNVVKNPHVPQVQGFLDDLVAVNPASAVGVVGLDVAPVGGFALNVPAAGHTGMVDFDIPLCVIGCVKQLVHELLDNLDGEPVGSQPHGDLAGGQIYRLHPLQGLHVGGIILRVEFGAPPCPFQLLPHVAGKIFVGGKILFLCVATIPVHGVQEDHAGQVGVYLLFGLAGQLHHKGHIHLGLFRQ